MVARSAGDLPPVDQGLFLVHLAKSRKLAAEGQYEAARREIEGAEFLRPHDEDVLNLISVIEYKRGRFLEAASAARELLQGNPGSAILHANLGLILLKAGALDEAEHELRRAVELQPDHARSHLYLGLLYRNRGKLGLALEHLRFAGARKAVEEIESTLRRASRTDVPTLTATARAPVPVPAPAPPQAAAPPPPAPPAPVPVPSVPPTPVLADERRTLEGPSARETPPPSFWMPMTPAAETGPAPIESPIEEALPLEAPFVVEESSPAPASPTSVTAPTPAVAAPTTQPPVAPPAPAAAKPAPPRPAGATRPLFEVREDGGLEVSSRGVVFVRKGSVVWYSGKIRFASEPAFRGTSLDRILRANGKGQLFISDIGRRAIRRDLEAEALFLEGSRLLALDEGLSFRLEPIHDFRRNRRLDVLKIQGKGSVVLSVGGPLLDHAVSGELPL
ncbi:MAG TPA: tetratricopeptide repeat protein, partial [Thermoanaerobaculia bacterium]